MKKIRRRKMEEKVIWKYNCCSVEEKKEEEK